MQFFKPTAGLVFLISILAWMPSVVAGELTGNSFVSEKFDPIEIMAPGADWTISDDENDGTFSIATLDRADGKSVIFFSGAWKSEVLRESKEGDMFFIKVIRKSLVDLGLIGAPIERARLGGRDVLRTKASGVNKHGVEVVTPIYVITGNKAYYGYTMMVLHNAPMDPAMEALERLITTTKVY